MSSSNDKIIRSIEDVIAAVDRLVGNIQDASDVDNSKKHVAIETVSVVAQNLEKINRTLLIDKGAENNHLVSSDDMTESLTGADGISLPVPGLFEHVSEDLANLEIRSAGENKPLREEADQVPGFSANLDALSADEDAIGDGEDKSESKVIFDSASFFKDHPPQKNEDIASQLDSNENFEADDVSPDQANNLMLIKGIDEDVCEILAAHEIHTFQDIAHFQEADAMQVSEELGDPGRVARECWVEQAAMLLTDQPTFYALSITGVEPFNRISFYENEVITPFEMRTSFQEEDKDAEGAVPSVDDHVEEMPIAEDETFSKEVGFIPKDISEGRSQDDLNDQPQSALFDGEDQDVSLSDSLGGDNEENSIGDVVLARTDGAMWHEEVSLANDYVAPDLNEVDEAGQDPEIKPSFESDEEFVASVSPEAVYENQDEVELSQEMKQPDDVNDHIVMNVSFEPDISVAPSPLRALKSSVVDELRRQEGRDDNGEGEEVAQQKPPLIPPLKETNKQHDSEERSQQPDSIQRGFPVFKPVDAAGNEHIAGGPPPIPARQMKAPHGNKQHAAPPPMPPTSPPPLPPQGRQDPRHRPDTVRAVHGQRPDLAQQGGEHQTRNQHQAGSHLPPLPPGQNRQPPAQRHDHRGAGQPHHRGEMPPADPRDMQHEGPARHGAPMHRQEQVYRRGEPMHKPVPKGFREKAKKFAETLQRSFKDSN